MHTVGIVLAAGVTVLLLYLAIDDYRTKTLPDWSAAIGIVLALAFRATQESPFGPGYLTWADGLVTTLMLLGGAMAGRLISRSVGLPGIGGGDIILLAWVGLYLGLVGTFIAFLLLLPIGLGVYVYQKMKGPVAAVALTPLLAGAVIPVVWLMAPVLN